MSEWVVKKRAGALQTGDRFIFDPEMGGEGEALTVTHIMTAYGSVEIYTEETDFAILSGTHSMLTMAGRSHE